MTGLPATFTPGPPGSRRPTRYTKPWGHSVTPSRATSFSSGIVPHVFPLGLPLMLDRPLKTVNAVGKRLYATLSDSGGTLFLE